MNLESLSDCEVFLDEPIADEAGRGCFGAVYKSKLNGAVVVVKRLHDIFTGRGGHAPIPDAEWKSVVGKFIHEIDLLGNQRHPNIVQFLGVHGLFGDIRDIGLVMENMDMDLRRFMNMNKGNIPLSVKLSILKDTANGVTHLHSKDIVHRDLNAGNVLLTSSLQAKVADLGVSRIVRDQQYQQGLTVGPGALDFMPPEALAQDPKYGPKLDCFSFGHLSLYLANEEYPTVYELTVEVYPQRGEFNITKRSVWLEKLGNQHPLYRLIRTCLHDDPKQRWEMKKIGNELESLMLQHQHRMPKFIELITKQQEYEESSKSQLERSRAMEQQNVVLSQQLKELHDTNKKSLKKKEEEIEQRLRNSMEIELQTELEKSHEHEIQEMKLENEKQKKQMDDLKTRLEKTGQERNQLIQKVNNLENQLKKTEQERNQLTQQVDNLETQLEKTERQLTQQLNWKLEEAQKDVSKLKLDYSVT